MSYRVRELKSTDIQDINSLEKKTYGDIDMWRNHEIKALVEKFPKGQFVIEDRVSKRVIALSFAIILDSKKTSIFSDWQSIVSKDFSKHNPKGDVLYGVEMLVDASLRKRGLGKRLYTLRKQLMKRLGLSRMVIGARLTGYSHLNHTSPEIYLDLILRQKIRNKNIDLQVKEGFQPLKIITNYLPEDYDCKGHAVIMEYRVPNLKGI